MKKKSAIVFISVFLGGGCSPLAPQADRSRFFMLSPIPSTTSFTTTPAATASTSNLTLGVGPIYFPGYLRRPEVVTLASPNQVEVSADDRWAEPLDKNFERVVTENLTELLNTRWVEKYPWPRNVHVDYQIVIDVQSFDTNSDKHSQLIARWIIKDGETGQDLYASETQANSPVEGSDTGVSMALSADVATMSRDIASQLAQLKLRRSPNQSSDSPKTTIEPLSLSTFFNGPIFDPSQRRTNAMIGSRT